MIPESPLTRRAPVRLALLCALFIFAGLTHEAPAVAQNLPLPARAANAPAGSEVVRLISSLDFTNREQQVFSQVLAGNVPEFYRRFCSVSVTNLVEGKTHAATYFVAPDYLAVGSDQDYFFTPMTPVMAQRIADHCGCLLPTRKMVDDIYRAATAKLTPAPIPPGPQMITVPVFADHNAIVRTQRLAQIAAHPLGELVAGDKKDIVITARLTNSPGRVAIYGWHQTNGVAIQPLYLGHADAWADYSHGVRLVQNKMLVDGKVTTVAAVLADAKLAGLFSDEGVVTTARYPTGALARYPPAMNAVLADSQTNASSAASPAFKPNPRYGEQDLSFTFEPEVKIRINAPAKLSADKPILLILYALPNGNTTEQTFGRTRKPGADWHFDIQHIGAQTRFLREVLPDRTVVVAYLEAAMQSWPAWRKKHGDDKITEILAAVKKKFTGVKMETVLTGHSGGGSFAFGYLNTVKEIPSDIIRIAFLDSNYAYRATEHLAKLVRWLQASAQHHLCVLAYDDANALLDGKPFVTPEGGTWGKSHTMLKDFGAAFDFARTTRGDLETETTLGGRIQFLLKANPDRKILHTVQVERNGFIHAMLSGTARENGGYEYLGERAYDKWIALE